MKLKSLFKAAPKAPIVNTKLKKKLTEVIKDLIAKEYRKEALDIMTKTNDKRIGEFLYYYYSGLENTACMVIDSAKQELVKEKKMKQGKKDQFGKPL